MSVFRGVLNSKVSAGWSKDQVLVRETKGTNRLVIMNVKRKVLKTVCIVYYQSGEIKLNI